MTIGIARRRSKSRWFALGAVVLLLPLALGTAIVTAANGTLATTAGFEDADGNLIAQSPINFDWNSFSPVTWGGTAPYQNTSKTVNGWSFTGLTDAQKSNTDTGFAGGVKQDDNCASVNGGSAPNKDDLKRIYVATKSVAVPSDTTNPTHTFLELAWVRIPQNTTSPSAHVGFEFNQKTNGACPGTTSDGLVKRTLGDLLFVYDFEGSSTSNPTLTVRKWVVNGTPCDVSSDTGHGDCWGVAVNLTASGFAEAAVDTGANGTPLTALDTVAPTNETLGTNEFGEAGADLTAAGIFTSSSCVTLGQVEGVSRSSGNSGSAAMEDLVGPGQINVSNCGTVNIIKHTAPRGVNQAFGYTSTLAGSQMTCSLDNSPANFSLNDSGNTTADNTANTEHCINVPAGSYTVTEGANPSGFVFTSLSCTASTGSSGAQDGTTPKQADISVIGGGTVTCTYVNTQQLGAIKITKTDSKSGSGLAGATFSITGPNNYSASVTSGADGTICTGNLAFGSYTVTETGAPTGYVIDDSSGHAVTVDNNATCSDSPYVGEATSFSDTPTSDIQVNFRDGGSGTTSATISCDNATGTGSNTVASGWDTSRTVTGISAPTTITCTITIDP